MVQRRMHGDRQCTAYRGGLKKPQECFSIVCTLHQQDVPSGQPQSIFIPQWNTSRTFSDINETDDLWSELIELFMKKQKKKKKSNTFH